MSIVDREKEVARYSYDSWGKCTVVKNIDGIGTLNPIRWKSQYYDTESGFYYIDGRYYSPEIRRYISAENPERAMTNAGTLYGLNLYLLCLTNPVGMVYNGYTIETNAEMSYEPDELTDWQNFLRTCKEFWKSSISKEGALLVFVMATTLAIICPAFIPIYIKTAVAIGISLGVGAAIAGYRSLSQGNGYWEGFVNHIKDNWAQEVTIGFVLAMVTFGVKVAKAAIISKNAALARARELKTLPGEKPTMTSAAVDVQSGRLYYGDSGGVLPTDINPVLKNQMPAISNTNWAVANCAEFKAVNNALNAGVKLENLVVTTVRVRTLVIAPMCKNCQISIQGVLWVVSG